MKQCMAKVVGAILLACFYGVAGTNTNGQKGVVRTLSAKTRGRAKLDIGIGGRYAQDSEFFNLTQPDGASSPGYKTAKLLSSNINLAIAVAPFMDLSASLPIYFDKIELDPPIRDGGIGDPEVAAKFLYPPPGEPRLFYQAYLMAFTVPVGTENNGILPRHMYLLDVDESPSQPVYTAKLPTFKPMMLWTFDIGGKVPQFQFQTHINLGGVFSFDDQRSNSVMAGMAIEYSPVSVLTIFVDFQGESRWGNFGKAFDIVNDPMMLSPGMKLNTPAGIYFSFAGDFGLTSRPEAERTKLDPQYGDADGKSYTVDVAPKIGFNFSFGWNGFLTVQDDDKDGIKNNVDRCPQDKEDIDGFEDSDGCPDFDNDKDGIPDSTDKCDNEPEDKDGFEDEDGCPDPDNDGDGIADLQDQCPRIAEDFDGFEDSDGCPDFDNDKDGIPDSLDKCPNDPEDVDKFEDDDGCPEPDNDKDGIPDLKDKCPNEPETLNGFEDEDGCPDGKPKKKEPAMPKHQILEGVRFSSGSSNFAFDSYQFIQPVLKDLKAYPEIEVEIRGHTDSVGKYSSNMRLSQKRAESVRQYLIRQGIAPRRMRAVGFGPSSPIADNRNAEGRAKNRRIEIVRIK